MTTHRTSTRAARFAASDGYVGAPKRAGMCVSGWNLAAARISAHPTAA